MDTHSDKTHALLKGIAESLRAIEAMSALSGKDMLTAEEASIYTGLSSTHIYRLTSNREIPHYKRGKHVFFDKNELKEWLSETRVETRSETDARAEQYLRQHPRY